MEGRNCENAVFHLGVEEAGLSTDAFPLAGEEGVFVGGSGGEVADVMKHPTEGAVFLIFGECGNWECGIVLDEGEAGGKFTGAEAGLVEALAVTSAAIEHVEMLSGAVVLREFWAIFFEAVIDNFEMGFDDIGDILQQGGGALLSLVFDDDADSGDAFSVHCSGGGLTGLGADFVATDIGKADGLEDMDAVDDPADLRLPINCLKNATGSGWGDHIIRDALDLHFWSGKAGEVAGDVQLDAVGHEIFGVVL